jgi:hypothetical protein
MKIKKMHHSLLFFCFLISFLSPFPAHATLQDNTSKERKYYLEKIKLYQHELKNPRSDQYLMVIYHQLASMYEKLNELALSKYYYRKLIQLKLSTAQHEMSQGNNWMAGYDFEGAAEICATPLINDINCQKNALQNALLAYKNVLFKTKANRAAIEKSNYSEEMKKTFLSNYRLDMNTPLERIRKDEIKLKKLESVKPES